MRKGLLVDNNLPKEVNINVLTGASLFPVSGLENDLENNEENVLKIEIELELDNINNTGFEIEIEIKRINSLIENIKVDEEALKSDIQNKGVIDYSIMNYNQLAKEQQLEPLELGGLQGALDSIKEGFKYVIDNKKEILMKAWNKLVELYNYFLKLLSNFWKKSKLAISQFRNYPKQVMDMLSVFPSSDPVAVDLLSKETKEAVLRSFSMFALMRETKKFSLGRTTDMEVLRETFSDKMFIDTDKIIETGIMPKRDVELLNYLSNPDILNKNFNPVSMSNAGNFKISFSNCMPLNFLGTRAFFLFADKAVDVFSKSMTDTQNPDDNFKIAVESSTINDKALKELVIDLGTYGDVVAVVKLLGEFLNDGATKAIDKQIKDIDKLDTKLVELNKAWHTVQSTNLEVVEKEIKKYNAIYAILKSVIELNITMSLNLNKDLTRTLGLVANDTKMNEKTGGK